MFSIEMLNVHDVQVTYQSNCAHTKTPVKWLTKMCACQWEKKLVKVTKSSEHSLD